MVFPRQRWPTLLLIASSVLVAFVVADGEVADHERDVRTARSGAELAAAFADEGVSTVLVEAGGDLTLADSDWEGIPVPVRLSRNFTIRGSAAPQASWPVLHLLARQKVQLMLDGVTLRLQYLVLHKYRSDNVLRAPALHR
ncbi:hypothetical protein TSOC_006295 [Tetrabaena socialis]|uniref:Uncharacterized protein n=1 Tax=Tetrabaena socialis TaxID=47790 RepID=A0A2J8A425_9CHLO|nr:hypothetical protein TSOC_006295 [Tetrabaena socialis]|eukprot:PNH07257.1 hypothetical protein TSOC_006295 [Tetrabaena socialis]